MLKTNRRNFLTKMLTLASTLPFLSFLSCEEKSNSVIPEDKTCETSEDILGPFYRENAPVRSNLNVNNHSGVSLVLSGKVLTNDCITPIEGAKVEIWHANESGEYDNTTSDFAFRATAFTDQNGNYEFSTITPGRYLNGNNYRPSHIHFYVSAADHETLVTQLYFLNDPFINSDPWASDESASDRIIQLQESRPDKFTGIFDIKLKSNS